MNGHRINGPSRAESATTELTEAAEIFWRVVLSVLRVLRGGECVSYEMAGFGFSGLMFRAAIASCATFASIFLSRASADSVATTT